MSYIEGDYLEIAFDKKGVSNARNFSQFYKALVELGLKYSGRYFYHDLTEVDNYIPTSVYKYELLEKVAVKSELEKDFECSGKNVIQIEFELLTADGKVYATKLTYLDAIQSNWKAPMAIWISGDDFFESKRYQKSQITGCIKKLFIDLVEALNPEVGIITDEAWPLVPLAELENDSSATCFKDFYFKKKYLNKKMLETPVEQVDTYEGVVFFSSEKLVEIKGRSLKPESQEEFGFGVAKYLSKALCAAAN